MLVWVATSIKIWRRLGMATSGRALLPSLKEDQVIDQIRDWSDKTTGTKMWERYWACHNEIVEGLKEAGLGSVDGMEKSREDEKRYQKAEAEMFIAAYQAKAFDYTLQRDYDLDLAADYIVYLMVHSKEGRAQLKELKSDFPDLQDRLKEIIKRIDGMLQRSMSL